VRGRLSGEAHGVVEGGLHIVHAARAHDHQQAVVALVEDGLGLRAPADDRPLQLRAERLLVEHLGRRDQRDELVDAAVAHAVVHARLGHRGLTAQPVLYGDHRKTSPRSPVQLLPLPLFSASD
jgi:hypothetical protein